MSIPSPDRRHHARIAFRAPAALEFANRSLSAVVLDLSLKGALVELPEDAALEAAEACALRVRLDETDTEISMACRVAHVAASSAGLVCLGIDLDSVTHLRRLVELNLGDPQLLERELSALRAS